MRLCLVGLASVLMAAPAIAAEAPTPAALAASLAGRWTGALGYRDYQTDRLTELPVQSEIRAIGDGVTLVRVSTFDDGPRVGAVRITTASLFDPAAGTVSATSLRKGRPVEVSTDRVSVVTYADPTHWTLRYEADGADDDKPAKLRVTETRDGDTLLSVKDVLPATATDGMWRFRNQTRLRKVPG